LVFPVTHPADTATPPFTNHSHSAPQTPCNDIFSQIDTRRQALPLTLLSHPTHHTPP
jgi:hypothetical protein